MACASRAAVRQAQRDRPEGVSGARGPGTEGSLTANNPVLTPELPMISSEQT